MYYETAGPATKLTFHSKQHQPSSYQHSSSKQETTIQIFQIIKVAKKLYSQFYHTGCFNMFSRYQAVNSIQSRTTKEQSGTISIDGTIRQYCHCSMTIRKHSVVFVWNKLLLNPPNSNYMEKDDLIRCLKDQGNDIKKLLKLPEFFRCHTSFMLGIKYCRHYPQKVFQMSSGLTTYKSYFKNTDGTRGFIGGPYKVFTETESRYYISLRTFYLKNTNYSKLVIKSIQMHLYSMSK